MKYDYAKLLSLLICFFAQTACATTFADLGAPCADPAVQNNRSIELQKISREDQADREWQMKGIQPTLGMLEDMAKHDLERRKRVGEILGEGCFKSADDYAAAYIVYQHGNTPDQYYQAFLWSKKALELGKSHMKSDVAMAVDRYLVSIGHKELFGTQASQATLGGCWCIQPVEDSFPASIRSEYRGGPVADYTGLAYLTTLNKGKSCPVNYCPTNLLPSPKGTLPGFW
jgi:hypothetical protein